MSHAYPIVVGIDFTDASEVALRKALDLSRRVHVEVLHVVHVLPAGEARLREHLSRENERIETAYAQVRTYVLDHAQRIAEHDGTRDAEWGQQCVFHVRRGEPAEAIHQVAVDVDAELIVVGTHQRRGIAKLLEGSVAERLVSMARLPVLVACEKDLAGLTATEVLEPRRAGEDLNDHAPNPPSRAEHLLFTPRSQHISGLL